MIDLKKIADDADIIVNGYAFTKDEKRIKVLNLNNPIKASVLQENGEVIETNMDNIELSIVKDYLVSSLKYMEN